MAKTETVIHVRISKAALKIIEREAVREGRSNVAQCRRILETSFCPECGYFLKYKTCSCKAPERM
jgi:hypothetical protein